MLGMTLIAILVAVGVGRATEAALGWTYLRGPTLVAAAIAAIPFSFLTYRVIERPCIEFSKRPTRFLGSAHH